MTGDLCQHTAGMGHRPHRAATALAEMVSGHRLARTVVGDAVRAELRECAGTLIAALIAADLPQTWMRRVQPLINSLREQLDHDVNSPTGLPEVTDGGRPLRLLVAAREGGTVGVTGLLVPARVLHAARADTVVIADDCEIKHTEHHHFERVGVASQDLFDDGAVRSALRDLVHHPSSHSHDRAFRNAIVGVLARQRGAEPAAVEAELANSFAAVVTHSGVVQLGDGSTVRHEVPIRARYTELPLAELLVQEPELRAALVAAIRDTDPAGNGTKQFLHGMLRAARAAASETLLAAAATDGSRDAALFGLFGLTSVRSAGVVLAGAGNTLSRGVEVEKGTFFDQDVGSLLSVLRREFGPLELRPDRGPELDQRRSRKLHLPLATRARPRPATPDPGQAAASKRDHDERPHPTPGGPELEGPGW